MCLETLDEKPKKIKFGWKVFRVDGDNLYGEYYNRRRTYRRGWNRCHVTFSLQTSWNPNCLPPKHYPAGFHVFKYKKDAVEWLSLGKGWTVKKVEVRNIVASGQQFVSMEKYAQTIIAKSMRIIDY